MSQPAEDFTFRLAEEVIYHGARRDFLAGAHRWAMFLTILFGAGAAATAYPLVSGLMVSAIGAADIAFDFTGRAQAHADARRRYLDLAQRCLANPENAQAIFDLEWRSMSADEPALYRWAALIAHRNACIALGIEAPTPLPLWKRLIAHIWSA